MNTGGITILILGLIGVIILLLLLAKSSGKKSVKSVSSVDNRHDQKCLIWNAPFVPIDPLECKKWAVQSTRQFVAFDYETTGLHCYQDSIIEIGAVRYRDLKKAEVFHTFVKPNRPIPAIITQLTGIKDSDVSGAPDFSEALTKFFVEYLEEDDILVAHNAAFEVAFSQCVKCTDGSFLPIVDTLAMSRKLHPNYEKYSLQYIAAAQGIDIPSHTALKDAETCALIYINDLPVAAEHEALVIPDSRMRIISKIVSILADSGIRKELIRIRSDSFSSTLYIWDCFVDVGTLRKTHDYIRFFDSELLDVEGIEYSDTKSYGRRYFIKDISDIDCFKDVLIRKANLYAKKAIAGLYDVNQRSRASNYISDTDKLNNL